MAPHALANSENKIQNVTPLPRKMTAGFFWGRKAPLFVVFSLPRQDTSNAPNYCEAMKKKKKRLPIGSTGPSIKQFLAGSWFLNGRDIWLKTFFRTIMMFKVR